MTLHLRWVLPLAYAACTTACVSTAAGPPTATVTHARPAMVAPERATRAVSIGHTKAAVISALGETQVIRFESGFEVWLYRLSGDTAEQGIARLFGGSGARDAAEFVVLFAPSGVVAKTRIRPAPRRGDSG